MRIVSWNKQKLKLHPNLFAKMLALVEADVIVLQETSGHVSAEGWDFFQFDGDAQDTYTLGVRKPGTVRYSLHLDDPRSDPARDGGSRKFLVARVELGGEKVTIASCHAPHVGGTGANSSDAARDYMRALAICVGGRKILKPMKGQRASAGNEGASKRSRERSPSMGEAPAEAPKAVIVDIFLGDTNLYTDMDSKAAFKEWMVLQIGYTTGHRGRGDGGSPLDRIALRPDWQVVREGRYSYGRVLSSTLKPGGVRGTEAPPNGTGLRDLRMLESKNLYSASKDPGDAWGDADHLAIYFDTGRAAGLADSGGGMNNNNAAEDLEVRELRTRRLPNKKE